MLRPRSANAQQTFIGALNSGKAVSAGTVGSPAPSTGLYGGHAYDVLGYQSSTGLFTLYNPWGSNQPAKLTWSQLVANCDGFAVGDAAAASAGSVSHATIAPAILPRPVTLVSGACRHQRFFRPAIGVADGLGSANVQAPARSRRRAADAVFAGYGAPASRPLPPAALPCIGSRPNARPRASPRTICYRLTPTSC